MTCDHTWYEDSVEHHCATHKDHSDFGRPAPTIYVSHECGCGASDTTTRPNPAWPEVVEQRRAWHAAND